MSFGCFSVLVSRLPKKSQKNVSRPPIWTFWCPNALQSDPREAPKGDQNIHTKSSPSRHGHPPAPFEAKKWSPEAGTPSKKHRKALKNRAHNRTPTTKNTSQTDQGNAAHRDRISLRHGGGSALCHYRYICFVLSASPEGYVFILHPVSLRLRVSVSLCLPVILQPAVCWSVGPQNDPDYLGLAVYWNLGCPLKSTKSHL